MKKLAAILLCALLVVCLWACGAKQSPSATEPSDAVSQAVTQEPSATKPSSQPTDSVQSNGFQFPEGTVVCGVDVSDMLRPDAYTAICEALSSHTLQLRANGKAIPLKGSEIGLTVPETAIDTYIAALERGEDPSSIDLLTYDSSAVRQKLAAALNSSARNAAIFYNATADCFQLTEDAPGKTVNLNSIMKELEPAILSLATQLSVTAQETEIEPSITADSDEAKAALARANAFLSISLTYSYTPDNGQTRYETVTKDNIGSFLIFNKDLSAYISSSALRSYVNQMSAKYSVKGNAGQFKTTGGYYISLTVDYAGQPVNTDALYDDIYYCLTNSISGTRAAPYLDPVECEEMAFDGNYVEINLSAQHLWVYRNGNCVVSTAIVSGCAYYHNTTPTGVYSIYGKSRGVNLVGETWNSYVNYWMPFKGGYGLHDASWRSEFGGDIYLYDGSHGCVNLPSGVAGSVYDNVSVGTKVILYGGATSAEPVQQNIIGTTEYNVPLGTQPFKLDAQPEYGEDKTLTYVSSNPAVADVTADGTVTVYAPGVAYITVTAAERQYYTSAQMIVTVNVTDPCLINGHTFGEWTVVTPATCTTDGLQTHICTVCGTPESQVIPAGHSYGEWVETTKPTCTADGLQTRTCTLCGAPETQILPATGHSYGNWTEAKKPTCTEDGEKARSCGNCGAVETESIPATGHSVSSWNTDSEPTCTTPGSKSGTCGSCGSTVTEEIPAKGHNFGSGGAFCDNGCGTPNPDFLPPKDDEEDPTAPDDDGDPADPA